MADEARADDAEARRQRAADLNRAIDAAVAGERRPSSPREFTDKEAREAAEDEAAREPDTETPAAAQEREHEGT